MNLLETWKRADAGTRNRYRKVVASVRVGRMLLTKATIGSMLWIVRWVLFVAAASVFMATFQYVLDVFALRMFSMTFIWTAVCVVSGVISWRYYIVLVRPMRRRAHEQSNQTKGTSQ